jgi:hypothetical protein
MSAVNHTTAAHVLNENVQNLWQVDVKFGNDSLGQHGNRRNID